LLLITISSLSIAQIQTIKDLTDFDQPSDERAGYYYKDLNGILTPFLGTWEYHMPNSNQVFRIHLKKQKITHDNLDYSEDEIRGYYEMLNIDPNTGVETIVYTSNKNMAGTTLPWVSDDGYFAPIMITKHGISCTSPEHLYKIGGKFHEVCQDSYEESEGYFILGYRGVVEITINTDKGAIGSTASWQIRHRARDTKMFGLIDATFKVPTEISNFVKTSLDY